MIEVGYDTETGHIVLVQGKVHVNVLPEDEDVVLAAIQSRKRGDPKSSLTDRSVIVAILAREGFAFSTDVEEVDGEVCYKVSTNETYMLFNPDGSLRYIAQEEQDG